MAKCNAKMDMTWEDESISTYCDLQKGHKGKHQSTTKYKGGRECILRWLNRGMK